MLHKSIRSACTEFKSTALPRTDCISHLERQYREAGEGRVFPILPQTERNKTALHYVQSTFSDTAKVKLQILYEHLQHVQTSNLPREGAALYTSPSCAPRPKHKSREWFRSKRQSSTNRVTDILEPMATKREGNVIYIPLYWVSCPTHYLDLM